MTTLHVFMQISELNRPLVDRRIISSGEARIRIIYIALSGPSDQRCRTGIYRINQDVDLTVETLRCEAGAASAQLNNHL